MRKTIAMVLAGGRVDELAALTERRPKSAVLFGGSYRIIDFVMTNIIEAGIERVGILSQYRPYSLIDHVAGGEPWDLCGRTRFATVLPPYQGATDTDWYRGTADALYQNIDFIERHAPDDVLVVSGDHIYRMDYRPLMHLHAEMEAQMTMVFKPVAGGASRFGIGQLDATGRIVRYDEKPAEPLSNLASMTVYLFRRDVLVEALRKHARSGRPSSFARTSEPWDRDAPSASKTFQIYDEIVPRIVEGGRAYGVIHEGYWEYTRTIDEYFNAHQDLVADPPVFDLESWMVRTNARTGSVVDPAPTRCGPGASVSRSLVCAGCNIQGTVIRSVLSPGVVVGHGAVVADSVLWHGTRVEDGAALDRVIADKFVTIGNNARVGVGDVDMPNSQFPDSLSCGATVIGRNAGIPAEIEIGRNCIIYPGVEERHFEGRALVSGQTLRSAPMGS